MLDIMSSDNQCETNEANLQSSVTNHESDYISDNKSKENTPNSNMLVNVCSVCDKAYQGCMILPTILPLLSIVFHPEKEWRRVRGSAGHAALF